MNAAQTDTLYICTPAVVHFHPFFHHSNCDIYYTGFNKKIYISVSKPNVVTFSQHFLSFSRDDAKTSGRLNLIPFYHCSMMLIIFSKIFLCMYPKIYFLMHTYIISGTQDIKNIHACLRICFLQLSPILISSI